MSRSSPRQWDKEILGVGAQADASVYIHASGGNQAASLTITGNVNVPASRRRVTGDANAPANVELDRLRLQHPGGRTRQRHGQGQCLTRLVPRPWRTPSF
jgi:hypothetical protein